MSASRSWKSCWVHRGSATSSRMPIRRASQVVRLGASRRATTANWCASTPMQILTMRRSDSRLPGPHRRSLPLGGRQTRGTGWASRTGLTWRHLATQWRAIG
eukprot:6261126-Pyramimonas_sp.AAC.1